MIFSLCPAFLLLRLSAGLPKSPLTEAAATQRRDAEAKAEAKNRRQAGSHG
jgi:hypothetical protein